MAQKEGEEVSFDEEKIDRSWKSTSADRSLKDLSKTLSLK